VLVRMREAPAGPKLAPGSCGMKHIGEVLTGTNPHKCCPGGCCVACNLGKICRTWVNQGRVGSFLAAGLKRSATFILFASLCVTAAWGQTGTGSMGGEVADPSGAMVTNATVTATPARGASTRATTDGRGAYSLKHLEPGIYTLIVQAPGFAVLRKQHILITAGQPVRLNLQLTVSTAQASVEVRARPVEVSISPTENASSVTISGSGIKSLADDPDTLLAQIQELAGPSIGPNGGEIYIDGFTGGDLPPKSAIREIRVNQDPFSAAYDRLGYGRIDILTKPGSETWHGSGFIVGNSSAFNSHSPFLASSAQPPYHTLLYGGRLGGPLGRKSSFFLATERRNINRDNLVNTEALDSGLQPFSLVTAVSNPRVLTSISPRIDYQLTPNNTISGRYHFFGVREVNDGVGSQSLPSQAYTFIRNHHLLQVSDSQILSPRALNQLRFQYLHFHNTRAPQDFSPTLQVLGAFTSGGNSDGSLDRSESHYELQNLTTINFKRHDLRFGGFVRDIRRRESTNSNFNGTFVFNSLADYQATEQDLAQGMTMAQIQAAGVGPSQFNITGGNPVAAVNRLDGSLWVQDDWRVRANLSLSYGLRFESENAVRDHADWAPRLGIAWGLGHGQDVKTVLRAGFGIFYDRFDDDQMIQAERLNGANQVSYVIPAPVFFPVIPPLDSLISETTSVPTVYRIASNLKSPYALESAASIEQQITRNATASVTYVNSRGERRLLTNNINAPLPGTYDPANPTSGIRPLGASAGNIYAYVSQGIFRQNQIIANFRFREKAFSLFGYYAYNNAQSDTAGVDSFAADPWNILADYGRAQFDIRHRFFVGGSLAMPFGIQLYPMLMARSGLPFSITLGEDLFGTGIHNGRPAYATSSTPTSDIRATPYGTFDIHPGATAILIPPNTATGPAAFTFDIRVSRTFGFGASGQRTHGSDGGRGEPEHHRRGGLGGRGLASGGFDMGGGGTERRYALTVSVEAENVLNNANLGIPVGNINSPLFGHSIDLTGGPYSGQGDADRRINLRLSFSF
jgi:Carboxypeptidase regulatory-like domain